MKVHSFSWRLLSLFVALFVLFSSSLCVSAMEIDGFTVSNKYNVSGNSKSFDTVIPAGVVSPTIFTQINLPESIPRGQPFDLTVRIKHSTNFEFARDACTVYSLGQTNSYSIKNNLSYETDDTGVYTTLIFKDINVDFIVTHAIIRYHYDNYDSTKEFTNEIESIRLEYVSDSSLISGIIQWVKSIYEGIVNLPTKISNALSSFFEMVADSVVELGNTLLNGIKNLFVPSEEDLTTIKNNWDNLLEDRFGALYQVIELIDDYSSAFGGMSGQGMIEIPSISIPLGDSSFVFGGWSVPIVPQGFDIIFSSLQTITSILATCMFVNGLRNRFERLVGSE